ncbi:hypothetical protein HN935_03020 [archaeon]|nr:hypothetical protein [archaeon]
MSGKSRRKGKGGKRLRKDGQVAGGAVHVNKYAKQSRAEERAAELVARDRRQNQTRQAPPERKYCSMLGKYFERGSDCPYHSTVSRTRCHYSAGTCSL